MNGATFLSPAFSVPGGSTTLPFGLFDVLIPLGTTAGTYSLNHDFALLGGPVSGDQDPLANVPFTVVAVAVPEPGTFGIVAGAMAVCWGRGRLRRRKRP